MYNARPGNCQAHPDDVDWFCVSLGAGYLVAEVLLPLYLLLLFTPVLLVPAFKSAFAVTKRATTAAVALAKEVKLVFLPAPR